MDFEGMRCRELISAEAIARRVKEMGEEITRDYADAGDELTLVGVLKGSILFLADLSRSIELPCTLDMIGIASYGDATTSSGVVRITSDLTKPAHGRHIIVVEDIVDTGLTMNYLLENLRTRQPKSVKVCSLLHKPDRCVKPVPIAYLGFTIPNEFVVGYGLDYKQRYRNLPYIGVMGGAGE